MMRASLIPAGVTLTGEIRGQGDLTVAGVLEGPIQIDGHLVIDAGAMVRGEVKARSIVIRGTLLGPAIADETIKLEAGAKVVGDARADRVSVVEGALLRGRITMMGAQASRRSSSGSVAGVTAPRTLLERASPITRSSSGVLGAPIEAPAPEAEHLRESSDRASPDENERQRLARPGAPPLPLAPAPADTPPLRRPPAPVIPGVGRQRARRKDGGIST